jgi:hypothetical protein
VGDLRSAGSKGFSSGEVDMMVQLVVQIDGGLIRNRWQWMYWHSRQLIVLVVLTAVKGCAKARIRDHGSPSRAKDVDAGGHSIYVSGSMVYTQTYNNAG